MDIIRAKRIVLTLAEGIDPLTGEVLPSDHICNQGEVVRALYTLLNTENPAKETALPENAGAPWTTEADEELKEMHGKGIHISELSKHFGRTKSAIKSRLNKLGITE